MSEDYKPLIIEMTLNEWLSLMEGVRRVHDMENASDDEVEKYVKELIFADLDYRYVCHPDDYKKLLKGACTNARRS